MDSLTHFRSAPKMCPACTDCHFIAVSPGDWSPPSLRDGRHGIEPAQRTLSSCVIRSSLVSSCAQTRWRRLRFHIQPCLRRGGPAPAIARCVLRLFHGRSRGRSLRDGTRAHRRGKTCRGHLRAVRALFGAQVCLHPHERAALGLPFTAFDPALERLAAKAAEGLCAALAGGYRGTPYRRVRVQTAWRCVGAIARGDVREAMLLQHAASTAAKSNPIVPGGAKATGGGGGDSDSVDDHHNLLAVRVRTRALGHALVTGLHGQQLDNMIAKQLRPPVPQVQVQ